MFLSHVLLQLSLNQLRLKRRIAKFHTNINVIFFLPTSLIIIGFLSILYFIVGFFIGISYKVVLSCYELKPISTSCYALRTKIFFTLSIEKPRFRNNNNNNNIYTNLMNTFFSVYFLWISNRIVSAVVIFVQWFYFIVYLHS